MPSDFRQSVIAAAERPDVQTSLAALYQKVQQEIDQRRPLCIISGRCCHFEEFGHRLYVTTLEMAAFLHELQLRDGTSLPPGPAEGAPGCPFQKNKLCSVHAFRPFGCRMFFCDATATDWQNEQYERFHADLKRLHAHLNVPYFYMEWRQALRECLSVAEDIL